MYFPKFVWSIVYSNKFKQANSISTQLNGKQVLLSEIQCFDIFYRCGIHQIVTTDITPDSFDKSIEELGWESTEAEDGKILYTALGLDAGLKVNINGTEELYIYQREKIENPKRTDARKNKDRIIFFEKTTDIVTINDSELKDNVIDIWLQIRPGK